MTENELRNLPVNYLKKYYGISEGSTGHKAILSTYNNSKLCTRYTMTTRDAWCATAVSAAFIDSGLAGKASSGAVFECVECSCNNMIALAKKQGIWVENDAYRPSVGDVVLYDWQDSGYGDNKGASEHVGLVASVFNNTIRVIEGNCSNTVKYRSLSINGKYIRGFIAPNYSKKTTGTTSKPTAKPTTTKGGFEMATLKTVKNGSTGATVKSLQALLNGKNSAGLSVDGDFGAKTLAAVKNYQTKKKLEVDGIVGTATWTSLLTK